MINLAHMNLEFKILPSNQITIIIPLLQELGGYEISEEILTARVAEMVTQNYQCIGIFDEETLIGCCGLWFQTRHYAGKSCEMDHVIITKKYQSKGIGKELLDFVYVYAKERNCNWVELNTYVHNFASHKFYYNHGFVAKGYHFVKDISKL